MKCIHCEVEIESDDNFCWNCGHWTAKGYSFLKNKNNIDKIIKGDVIKQDERFNLLVVMTLLTFLLFFGFVMFRGEDMFKPFVFLKKQIDNYVYGYSTSIINTDNIYNKKNIETIDDAYEIIKKDFSSQSWKCFSSPELSILEYELMDNYNIASVTFCDISYNEATKISNVIKRIYELFPNIKGGLTNITITNAKTQSEYIAYFQPRYQFVNSHDDIANFNKVNKTQILLNSYYFLNENILSTNINDVVGSGWYVDDATWESAIAHELGHYISFMTLLKEYGLSNITLETNLNSSVINKVLEYFDSGSHSKNIVSNALNNYNLRYNSNLTLEQFSLAISNYSGTKDKNGNIIFEETIAEGVHDYYLHGTNCKKESYEIIQVIKDKL